jgi:hypothetical protein
VSNTGIDPLVITTAVVSGAASASYTVALGTCSASVASGANCQLLVTFNPTIAAAAFPATVTINSNASNNPRSFNLTGRAP